MATDVLVNLTLPTVIREIEAVLDTYAQNAHRRAFAIPEMRHELEAYVLSRIPNQYAVVSEDEDETRLSEIPPSSFARPANVRQVICDGVECLLRDRADRIVHQLPDEANPSMAPSHWFG
ncbi:MAG: hypothetical protein AAFY15_01515 [Cyanobacteria bacterium J06648_11]